MKGEGSEGEEGDSTCALLARLIHKITESTFIANSHAICETCLGNASRYYRTFYY